MYKTVSILVPTWQRPEFLHSCLKSLLSQTFLGTYEIIVIARPDDLATLAELTSLMNSQISSNCSLKFVEVLEPGFVRALKIGFLATTSEIVAFCDDDAIYPPNWLEQLEQGFISENVGGVGGPIKERGLWQGAVHADNVSKISPLGKMTYNVRAQPKFIHAVDVAMLPGANMAYRKSLLSEDLFDFHLDGLGFSPGNELVIGWSVRRQGYSLNYLPQCVVGHFSAPWVESKRHEPSRKGETYGHNMNYAFARFAPLWQFTIYFLGSLVVGDKVSPGPIRNLYRWSAQNQIPSNNYSLMKAKLIGAIRGFCIRYSARELSSCHKSETR